MKVLGLILGFCLIATFAFSDVSARVLSYEKEIINGKHIIKVTSEYTYPDATKHIGITRYDYRRFSKDIVENDIQIHCKTITRYYLKENIAITTDRKIEMVDDFIAEQDAATGIDKITNLTYNLTELYLDDLDITIDAEGTTEDAYN